MKKKVLSVLLAGVFVLGALTGCGKDNSQSDSGRYQVGYRGDYHCGFSDTTC